MGSNCSETEKTNEPLPEPDPLQPNYLTQYKYSDRKKFYRSEQMEVEPLERESILSHHRTPVSFSIPFPQCDNHRIIIDTDIGTDLDDALALLYALRIPNLEILGVTTNYAVSCIRAEVAKLICDLHCKCRPDYPSFPVVAGSSRPLGSHRKYFLTGREGIPFLSEEFIEQNWTTQMNLLEQMDAANFIAETVMKYPGEVTICSIGIPTNIALALTRHPEITKNIKEILVMGCGSVKYSDTSPNGVYPLPDHETWQQSLLEGNFLPLYPNHNISADTIASKIIFSTPDLRLRVIPHYITCQFWLHGASIEHLKKNWKGKGTKVPSTAVGKLMKEWFFLRFGQNGQCPHDSLTIHEAVHSSEDGCLNYVRGTLFLHEWGAFGTFMPHQDGLHYLAFSVKRDNHFLDDLEQKLMEPDILDK